MPLIARGGVERDIEIFEVRHAASAFRAAANAIETLDEQRRDDRYHGQDNDQLKQRETRGAADRGMEDVSIQAGSRKPGDSDAAGAACLRTKSVPPDADARRIGEKTLDLRLPPRVAPYGVATGVGVPTICRAGASAE